MSKINYNNNVDLSNEGLLDLDLNYSNASGKLKGFLSNAGKKIKQAEQKVVTAVKTGAQNVGQTIKTGAQNVGNTVKTGAQNVSQTTKKVVKKISQKVGSAGKPFRNMVRGLVRKDILFNLKNNIHGTATLLYPAVASDASVKQRKYKSSAAVLAKSNYGQLVARWAALGGNESDLKSAITQGSNKKFLRLPYKSFNGNNSTDFYNFFANRNVWLGADGDRTVADRGIDSTTTSTGDTFQLPVTNIDDAQLKTSTDNSIYNTDTGEVETVDTQEHVGILKSFFAWLKALFTLGKDANPFDDGSGSANEFNAEQNADAGNVPNANEADNQSMQDLLSKGAADDAGGNDDPYADKSQIIKGIPNEYFWSGIAAIVIIGGIVGYYLIKGKNTQTIIK